MVFVNWGLFICVARNTQFSNLQGLGGRYFLASKDILRPTLLYRSSGCKGMCTNFDFFCLKYITLMQGCGLRCTTFPLMLIGVIRTCLAQMIPKMHEWLGKKHRIATSYKILVCLITTRKIEYSFQVVWVDAKFSWNVVLKWILSKGNMQGSMLRIKR